jgi:hypothetical protein
MKVKAGTPPRHHSPDHTSGHGMLPAASCFPLLCHSSSPPPPSRPTPPFSPPPPLTVKALVPAAASPLFLPLPRHANPPLPRRRPSPPSPAEARHDVAGGVISSGRRRGGHAPLAARRGGDRRAAHGAPRLQCRPAHGQGLTCCYCCVINCEGCYLC